MNRRHFLQTVTTLAAASALPTSSAFGAAKALLSAKPRGISRFGDGRDWFFERRLGLFVHRGIYALPGWHEQHQWRARVPRAEYVKLARQWNPTKFNPDACQAVGVESWGYRKDEDYYTDRHLIRSIDAYLARDGNYLLNVGPKPDGTIPAEASSILRRIGQWYGAVKESLEGVQPASHLTSNRNVMLTHRDRTLYVHLNKDPLGDGVKLKPLNVAPKHATLLNSGQPVDFVVNLTPADHQERKAYLRLMHLPANEMANTVLVVKLEFDRDLEQLVQPGAGPDQLTEWQK